MKRIEVNKKVIINKENIAKSIDDRLIGINVVCADGNENDGFVNYALAIDNFSQCCEYYGANFIRLSDKEDIAYIIHDDESDKVKKITLWHMQDNYTIVDADDLIDSSIRTGVYDKDDNLIAVCYVFNEHNGYYSHTVYTNINGNLEVECL